MKDWKRLVERAAACASHAEQRTEESRKEAEESKGRFEDAESARMLLQAVAAMVQQRAHGQIASIVSRCLEAVFEDPYEFRIEFEEKRGKTEAKILFTRNGEQVDPMSASGGGVVDVAAFAARVACLVLSRPARRRLLLLDEPWKYLSSEYRPRMKGLIETLADEMQVQFVIVTHDLQLATGKIVEIG